MAEQEKRKGGGAKLTRSETVTVRLDPQLRYLAELAARKQRRTLSSFIEWAVEDSLRQVFLYQPENSFHEQPVSVADEARRLWDVDGAERFTRLAILYPELLTHEEQEIWKLLNDSYLLLPAKKRNSVGHVIWNWKVLEDKVFPVLRHHWDDMNSNRIRGKSATKLWVQDMQNQVASGKAYPGLALSVPGQETVDDLEDDIPF